MSKLALQVQVFGEAQRSMLLATRPRALKVLHTGVPDRATLETLVASGLEMVVGRYVFPESGNDAEVETRCTKLISWADENLRWLLPRGVRVVLEVPYNEELQNGDALDRLCALTLRAMPRILAAGYDAAIGVFSEGNPSGQGHPNPFVDWPKFYPALRQARKYWADFPNGRVFLALHEYGVPSLGVVDGWHNFRYRKVWSGAPETGWAGLPADCLIPVLITESGVDGGIEGRREQGWRSYMDAPRYRDWLARTRAELEKDDFVWYSFVFLSGCYDQWKAFDVGDEVDLRAPFTRGARVPQWAPGGAPPPPPPTPAPIPPPEPTPSPVPPTFDVGEGFRALAATYPRMVGTYTEPTVYHFRGTDNEVGVARSDRGVAVWVKKTNAKYFLPDESLNVAADGGNRGSGAIRVLRWDG